MWCITIEQFLHKKLKTAYIGALHLDIGLLLLLGINQSPLSRKFILYI